MKVGDRMAVELLTRRVRAARARLERSQAQVATGKRVERPGDDPVAYTRAVSAREAASRAAEHGANVRRGLAMLDAAAAALDQAHDLVARARELAVAAASASATAEARSAAAAEVQRLRESLASLRATESQGEAVFRAAGRERRIEVAPGVTAPVSVDGDAAFVGPVDLDATLAGLEADLRVGDGAAVRGRLDGLARGLRQIEGAVAEAGARRAALEVAGSAAERAATAWEAELGAAVGADPIRAMSELAAGEAALRAALEVGTRLLRPVLAERL